jgi:hypothetical protein
MIFSSDLKEFYSNDAFKTQFAAFEGKPITQPNRFATPRRSVAVVITPASTCGGPIGNYASRCSRGGGPDPSFRFSS